MALGGNTMEHGLRRSAFDQSSYAYWTGKYGVINVKDFGAVGDGVHDDTAALQAAWAAMGTPAAGTYYIPHGIYKISSTLLFDGGYTGAGNDHDVIMTGDLLRIICDGTIQPVAGVGTAVHVRAMYCPAIQVRFYGGGQSSDNGLQLSDLYGPTFDVRAVQFAGTVLYYNGTTTSNSRVTNVNGGRIDVLYCGSALSLANGNGFGIIDSVWDDNSVSGSSLVSLEDLTILHYENYIGHRWGGDSSYLLIQKCGTIHIGKMSLGTPVALASLVEISDCAIDTFAQGIIIDEFFAGGFDAVGIGLHCVNSGVGIGSAETWHFSEYGLAQDGGVFNVGFHRDAQSHSALGIGEKISGVAGLTSIGGTHYHSTTSSAIAVGSGLSGTSILQISNGFAYECVSAGGAATIDVNYADIALGLVNFYDQAPAGDASLSIPNFSQCIDGDPSQHNYLAKGVVYTNQGPLTSLAGTTGGTIHWAQPDQGTRKVFIAQFDGYENDTTTDQTITFPTSYKYTPTVSTNSTGLSFSVDTTTLTIKAPDSTTTYSGVVEVVGI